MVDNLFKRFNYETSKKYVTLIYSQETQIKDADGKIQSTSEPFPFGPCKESFFNAAERRILDLMYNVTVMLCPDFDDEKIYL